MSQNELIIKANEEDVNTYSNFKDLCQKHMNIEALVDFDTNKLKGTVTTTYQINNQNTDKLILDLKGPKIVTVNEIIGNEKKSLKYEIYIKNEDKEALGTPLIIFLNKDSLENKKELTVSIEFEAEEGKCDAIQFLKKEQTYTKKYPFMFTQCEEILARTLLPCQDTPAVKITMNVLAKVKDPLTVLFGGIETSNYIEEKTGLRCFTYEQKIPIATYLIAFAGGEMEYTKINERCGIYTENGLGQAALKDFKGIDSYIITIEKYLNHPYEWGKYNLLVLPFSFPMGGMENPNLTFVTPTLLSGDASLANVVAHEICHSWTGNLVTNKNWKNFWMNEGFTVFLERKTKEIMEGEDLANIDAMEGEQSLKSAINLLGEDSTFTTLQPELSHIDPDEGFSNVPYEKGYQFLRYIEGLVGKENLQKALSKYIKKFRLKSIEVEDFKNSLLEYINSDECKLEKKEDALNKIDWNSWLYGKGMPPIKLTVKSKFTSEIENLVQGFLDKKPNENACKIFEEWHTDIKKVFLDSLIKRAKEIDDDIYQNIKKTFNLADKYNCEIKCKWYSLSLILNHLEDIEKIKEFLKSTGRMKFLKPIYFEWIKVDKANCKEFYETNKWMYHTIAVKALDSKLLK